MATGEQLTNPIFDALLSSWTTPVGASETFATFSSGGNHWAWAHGSSASELTYRISQDFTLATVATVGDIDVDISWTSTHASNLMKFKVVLEDPGSNTYTIGEIEKNGVTSTSPPSISNWLSNEDISATLVTGGAGTWTIHLYLYLTDGSGTTFGCDGYYDKCSVNIDSFTVAHTTTSTGTINVSSSATHAVAYSQTVTGTINVSAIALDATTIKTDYGYYFGTDNGTIHLTSDSYKGDAGVIIPCQYITKDTDFADQDQQSNDRWKTIYGVKVFYEDMTANTQLTVGISTDGGVTYESRAQTLGTGNEKRKDTTFYFIITGQFFRFKISNGSSDGTFKLLGMEVEYQDSGEHWTIA